MEISIIKSDGLTAIGRAWEISRPHEHDYDINQVMSIDAPISDMASVVLDVKSTIFEREIFTSMRDHIIWAQTSRVSDPFDWKIKKMSDAQCVLYDKMKFAEATGVPQDDYRLNMPMGAMTEFTMKISLRSLVKIADYFDHLKLDSSELRTVLAYVTGGRAPRFKLVEFIESPLVYYNGLAGDFGIITFEAPIALRAQLIRHKQLIVNDSLLSVANINDMPMNTLITIQVCASIKTWTDIIKKRSCWMAQQGLWRTVIEQVNRHLLPMDERLLPCANYCVYGKDAELRYTAADPGAPCPKHAAINKYPLSPILIEDIDRQILHERRPKFWENILDELR